MACLRGTPDSREPPPHRAGTSPAAARSKRRPGQRRETTASPKPRRRGHHRRRNCRQHTHRQTRQDSSPAEQRSQPQSLRRPLAHAGCHRPARQQSSPRSSSTEGRPAGTLIMSEVEFEEYEPTSTDIHQSPRAAQAAPSSYSAVDIQSPPSVRRQDSSSHATTGAAAAASGAPGDSHADHAHGGGGHGHGAWWVQAFGCLGSVQHTRPAGVHRPARALCKPSGTVARPPRERPFGE